jgi:hypothetical protein
MTPVQELELKRMTRVQWDTLRGVEAYGTVYGFAAKRVGGILHERGFIAMAERPGDDGFYSAKLTAAGVEALDRARRRVRSKRWTGASSRS